MIKKNGNGKAKSNSKDYFKPDLANRYAGLSIDEAAKGNRLLRRIAKKALKTTSKANKTA